MGRVPLGPWQESRAIVCAGATILGEKDFFLPRPDPSESPMELVL